MKALVGRRFQPGEGPSRGLLCDCTTLPINRFAALVATLLLGLFVAFVTATPGAAQQLGSGPASSNKSPGLVSLVPNSEMNRPG